MKNLISWIFTVMSAFRLLVYCRLDGICA